MSETQASVPQNKMGIMPINQLLVSISLPIVISMLVQALYNIVDSIFVSRINENALTAVSLVFPIQNTMIAVAVGTSVGMNALLAKSLGEKNFKEANHAATNGLFLAVMSSIVFMILGILGSRWFLELQTEDHMIIEYGRSYMQICCIFSLGLFGQVTCERLLQATGKSMFSMISQIVGAVINIILDPIMIFGLFGFPELGVAGAAIATVCGQFFALLLGLFLNMKKNTEISLNFRNFRPRAKTIKRIYSVGIPSMVMQSIGSIMVFGINKILLQFTATASAVFGIYFKLQSFIFMPIFGLNNGLVPILSYNYGARQKGRMQEAIRLSIIYAVCIMFIGFAFFQLIPDKLLLWFDASTDMLAIGVPALRSISFSFLLAGYCIIVSSVFQSLNRSVLSLIISVIRQLVVLLPVAYLLAKAGGLNYVWWAFPIAEVFCLGVSIIFHIYTYRTIIKHVEN